MSLKKHEQGDGPAFFAILIIGALAGMLAAIVEVRLAPPFWLHALLWIPFVLGGTVLSLRWLKAGLFAIHFRTRPWEFE